MFLKLKCFLKNSNETYDHKNGLIRIKMQYVFFNSVYSKSKEQK